jgi:hypothetical protein
VCSHYHPSFLCSPNKSPQKYTFLSTTTSTHQQQWQTHCCRATQKVWKQSMHVLWGRRT